MSNNDLNQFKEINFNDLIKVDLEKQKRMLNEKEKADIILNFNKKNFSKEKLESIFKYIFLEYKKKIILRNILDENYEYIKKLEAYFEIIKNNKK
ncbi:hypothetical protein [Fusobacterium polymorphum]|uniref:Uncharacterized protein n=1 Tax=Fusobacterium nucleatum subsp. polymorphum TaxID=76857 RepID=A0A241Q3L1_FUSNP|nr:hypothetical protein [Fusobacterium polymorphum]ASG29189.1 hypothetical protein CBG61_10045 [Fusobacterium polymorphum]